MGMTARALPNRSDGPLQVTLLELVTAVSEVTSDEREIVATVLYMLGSGRCALSGSFRGEPLKKLAGC